MTSGTTVKVMPLVDPEPAVKEGTQQNTNTKYRISELYQRIMAMKVYEANSLKVGKLKL